MHLAAFLLALGATARLTRFVTRDMIGLPIRQAIIRRCGPASWQAYFIECPWCVGYWLAAGLTVLAYYQGDTPGFAVCAGFLTISHLVGLASGLDR